MRPTTEYFAAAAAIAITAALSIVMITTYQRMKTRQ
jgi:hypothetical protein